jgi:hypothetical protein
MLQGTIISLRTIVLASLLYAKYHYSTYILLYTLSLSQAACFSQRIPLLALLKTTPLIITSTTQRTPRPNILLPSRRYLRIRRKVAISRKRLRQVLLHRRTIHTDIPELL